MNNSSSDSNTLCNDPLSATPFSSNAVSHASTLLTPLSEMLTKVRSPSIDVVAFAISAGVKPRYSHRLAGSAQDDRRIAAR